MQAKYGHYIVNQAALKGYSSLHGLVGVCVGQRERERERVSIIIIKGWCDNLSVTDKGHLKLSFVSNPNYENVR